MNRREVAYHEAGHAVAHILFGHAITEVSIVPRHNESEGHVTPAFGEIALRHFDGDHALRKELARQRVLIAYSGYAAQLLCNAQADRYSVQEDESVAYAISEAYYWPGDSKRWKCRQFRNAKYLMRDNRAAVGAVVAALLKHKTLDQSTVKSIVSAHVDNVPDTIDFDNLAGDLLVPEWAADIVGVSRRTLARWNLRHQGPKPYRIGRLVRYHVVSAPEGSATLCVLDGYVNS